MKRTLFRTLNVVMAVVVLMSSTGFGLIEHSCQMRGKKITRIGLEQTAFAGCQTDQKMPVAAKQSIKKTDCCQNEQRYENVDVTSSLSQLVAKFFKVVTESALATITMLVTTLTSWLSSANLSVVEHSPNAPPSAYGRALLAFVQSFLI